MKITRLVLGELETNCYLVSSENGEGIVIDPADDADTILAAAEKESVTAIKAVVLTHAHFDHMLAAEAVCAATNAPLYVGFGDKEALSNPKHNLSIWFSSVCSLSIPDENFLREGDVIAFGEETLSVMETPGHTQGCICLYAEGVLFSGDTLFRNSIGRLNFPGGDAQAMSESLARLMTLPKDTAVYSGHGPATTIGWEMESNPFLK